MEKLPAGEKVGPVQGESSRLKATVNMSNELCQIAASTSPNEKSQALNKLRFRYRDVLDMPERKLNEAIESGLQQLSQRAMTLGINTARSQVVHKARAWSGHAVEDKSAQAKTQDVGMDGVHGIESALNGVEGGDVAAARPDPEAILSAGIQDVTNTLVEDYKLNDVLLMVLETIYRGLSFKRALICIRDNKQNMMAAWAKARRR
jgi:hypothetical protein